jgi:tRNA-splicing ligase RtcB
MSISQITSTKHPIKIWAKLESVESQALDQLKNIANLPFIYKHVAVMPDVHLGKGATVGSVIATEDAIIPAAVGVDIGCGMLAVKTNLTASDLPDDLKPIRNQIERDVPLGRNEHKDEKFAENLDTSKLTVVDKLNESKVRKQIGTLGGGNHFIEICLDENQDVWIMLHSGSRNVGKTTAEIHIDKAKGLMKRYFVNLPDPDLAFLTKESSEFKDYVNDLFWCQEYAKKNRQVMLKNVVDAIKKFVPQIELVGAVTSCHHNYVEIENHYGKNVFVTRKGAIRARTGDLGIIPGSMGTKSYIVEGKGNLESFTSASHGAGRKMSRSKATQVFTKEDLEKQTAGVECKKDSSVIDEIPGAYKDIDQVIADQTELIEVKYILKQVLCVKG